MATQVKPTRLKITGTPSVGQVPMYVDANNFQWGSTGSSGYGRFLSLRDCATGQPISFPEATPYTYTTGDYYMVETVSTDTPPVNYRPNGSSYTGTASSTSETDEVSVGDVYVYDGSVWLLQSNNGKTVAFANIAGQPTDNVNLASALSGKLDTTALNNTAYGSSWSGDTTHAPTKDAVYDKINAMDTTIGTKANDSDVVKLTGNQSIAGTKTFTTSPVVPSKTSDATNTGTAIATEAQVYKKQDALATQTAYTSKGTSTKVPTITTNTLGQVTGITETNIAFPVTSVNGSTGAVTVPTGDVVGPASSTDGHLAVFDGVTGKLIKDGGTVPTSFSPTNAGSTGQVLTKTAGGYDWAAAPVTSVNGQTGAVTGLLTAETVVSGVSGTTYTIKVSNTAPGSGTPATTITFVTA